MVISKKDIKIIIVLAGVAILAIAYFAVYRNYQDKTEAAEAQISQLQPELEQLREYEAHKQEYQEGTAAYKENMTAILSSLPTEIWPEDQIMLARHMEQDLDITANSESFTTPVIVTQFQGVPLDSIDDYNAKVDMTSSKYQMTLESTMDYKGLKDALDYIYDQDNMCGLDSIQANWNAENQDLNVTMMINQYMLTWPDATGSEHPVPDVSKGNSDVFGAYGQ